MSTDTPARLDLDAYLARIGYAGELRPMAAVLEAVHLAHTTRIPFENLDVVLGRPIRLDLESLQAKLVRALRGGYCFEQNLLLAAALEELGFRVSRLAARVRLGATRLTPRTHMLLEVEADGAPWLADVGFGGQGPLKPVPLTPGLVSRQFAWTYRVADGEAGQRVLQLLEGDAWHDLYVFTAEPQHLVDYEVANHYVSTHPSSPFVRTLTAQLSTPDARTTLRGRELLVTRGPSISRQIIEVDTDFLSLLVDVFGISLPSGTKLPAQPPSSP
jgi:N-hydroxyarylamine O-acetyltransferase